MTSLADRPRVATLNGGGFNFARTNFGTLSTLRSRRSRQASTMVFSTPRKRRLSIARSNALIGLMKSGPEKKQGKIGSSRKNSQGRVSVVSRPCIHRRRRKLKACVFGAANQTLPQPTFPTLGVMTGMTGLSWTGLLQFSQK